MEFNNRRKIVALKQKAAHTLSFNPVVFSRMFWLWILLGALGGVTAGIYWLVLEEMIHVLATVMGLCIWVLRLPHFSARRLAEFYSPLKSCTINT